MGWNCVAQLIWNMTYDTVTYWDTKNQKFCVLQKEALMEQVAHQAVVMQFILEMASNSQQDPRGCFRHFFHKAKVRPTHSIPTVNVFNLPVCW